MTDSPTGQEIVFENLAPAGLKRLVFPVLVLAVLAGGGAGGWILRSKFGGTKLPAPTEKTGTHAEGCPTRHISTGINVSSTFTIEYPCGWHVLSVTIPDLDRDDVFKQIVGFDRLPFNLALAPDIGPLGADIEVWDYFPDPDLVDARVTESLTDWVAGVRGEMGRVIGQETVTNVRGTTLIHVSGETRGGTPYEVYVGEFKVGNPEPRRHVIEVIVTPTVDAGVRRTLLEMVGSLRLFGGPTA